MEKTKKQLLLGAHMSVAGGFEKAIERAESIQCTALQIFTKSNRQWASKPISAHEAETFRATVHNSNIKPKNIVVHAAYLINIGSPELETQKKSVNALIHELERCELLGIPYLVLHPGSHGSSDLDECIKRIAHNLDVVLTAFNGKTMVLLENMAGQGSVVCATFQQLALIREMAQHKKRIGFCFDTAHAFAAGYDLRTKKAYDDLWNEYDSIIGLHNLKVLHINDSKKELGSKVDRHEEIGKGKIGPEFFAMLFNDARFFDLPKILETPNDDLADYAKNMKFIEGLLTQETQIKLGK